MNEVILKRLVRTYYETTLGLPESFPYWGQLCDYAGSKDPKNVFYELIGYQPSGSYSSSEIYLLRREDAKRNYDFLRKSFGIKKLDQLSSLISRVGAKAAIMKKNTIPSEIFDEVKVLSEYIRMEDNLLVAVGDSYQSIGSLLLNPMVSLKAVTDYAEKLYPILMRSINTEVTQDKVKCFNSTLYCKTAVSEDLKSDIFKASVISAVIPHLYMDLKKAFSFYENKVGYQMMSKDEDYLQYLDQLHHKNVTMEEVFRSIGLEYYNPLKVYQSLGVIAQRLNSSTILVFNEHAQNIMLSVGEFEYCRERNYLTELFKSEFGEVRVKSLGMSLQLLRGVNVS